jgi:putative spermidine/putrescine transport system permease protein
LLLAPALLVLLGGFLVPTIFAMARAFTDFRPPEQQGLDNIVWFWRDPVMVETLIRTFAIAGIATVVVSVLAYSFAYIMTKVSARARAYLLLGVLLTNSVDLVIRNFAWIAVLQRKGMINNLLGLVGIEPLQFLGTPAAVVIGMVNILFPLMLLSLYPVLSRIDRNMSLAAMSLGARPATAFWKVYFPQSLPGVFAGGLLVFTMALGFFITPALLGSPREAMLSQVIQFYSNQPGVPWGRIGAMALALVVTAGTTLYISNVYQRRVEERGMS